MAILRILRLWKGQHNGAKGETALWTKNNTVEEREHCTKKQREEEIARHSGHLLKMRIQRCMWNWETCDYSVRYQQLEIYKEVKQIIMKKIKILKKIRWNQSS